MPPTQRGYATGYLWEQFGAAIVCSILFVSSSTRSEEGEQKGRRAGQALIHLPSLPTARCGTAVW